MKKLLTVFIATRIPLCVVAQSADKLVNEIKAQYKEAQAAAQCIGSDNWAENETQSISFQSHIVYDEAGPVEHTTEVLLMRARQNNNESETFTPRLVRETIDGAIIVYRELLFDKISGLLIFCYQRTTLPDDSVAELRFYYHKGKCMRTVPADEQNVYFNSPDAILSIAQTIKSVVADYTAVER